MKLFKGLLACGLTCFASLAFADRPNVLFIAVDDLRVELGCYDSEHVVSPHIDKLAESSTLFERAYCQQTVCNPSRASLLTGMRPDRLRVWDLPTHFRERRPGVVTLPQLFKQNGYHTQCIGKIFHNWRQEKWKGDPVSWSVPSILHYNSHGRDRPQATGELPANLASGRDGIECRDVGDEAYYDGRVAKAAVEALADVCQGEQPFFMAVGFWKPHTPFNAPKRYWDLYDRSEIPIPQELSIPDNVPDIALTSARLDPELKEESLREMHHGHLAAISYLDVQVGKVLEKLEELGERDNTIVVFWSDHGLHLGEHGLTRKTTAFELDARVPFMIRTPTQQAPARSRSLVELLDIYPTLAELCELEAPHRFDGISLVPILQDPAASTKEVAITQTPRPNYPRGELPENMGYSMRTDRFRYTEWRDFQSQRTIATELYDHENDPRETENLAGKAEHKTLVQDLSKTLAEHVDPKLRDDKAPPNVVLILADDLGYGDLSCYGSQFQKTHHIDALASSGVRFTDFHSAGPMCSPTRAATLTGMYQQRFGSVFDTALSGVKDRDNGLPLEAETIAEILKPFGYSSACFGKWHLGYQPPWLPKSQGFDEFRGLGSGDGDFFSHIDRSGNEDWWNGDQLEKAEGYTTELLTKYSVDFIKAHRNSPFFLYLPHLAIHFPWQGPGDPPHRKKGESYHQDKWGLIPDPSNVKPHVTAMINSLDQSVGAVLSALEKYDLANNTVVIFTSDNGGYLTYGGKYKNISSNGELRGQKTELYEGGQRVPAIVSWPGKIGPRDSDAVAHSIDLLPTIAQLTGAELQTTDGLSLAGHLIDSTELPNRDLFWRARAQSAVRRGPWKLVQNGDRIELYNLEDDLSESNNLASEKPDLVKKLQSAWREWEKNVESSASAL